MRFLQQVINIKKDNLNKSFKKDGYNFYIAFDILSLSNALLHVYRKESYPFDFFGELSQSLKEPDRFYRMYKQRENTVVQALNLEGVLTEAEKKQIKVIRTGGKGILMTVE